MYSGKGIVVTSVVVAQRNVLCTVCKVGAKGSESSMLLVRVRPPSLSWVESSEAASNVLH